MSYDLRTFKLAHPLRKEDAVEVGLPERTYQVNDEITLPYQAALRLVNAGFVAGAEPGNRDTVKAALRPVVKEGQPAPAPAGTEATGVDTAGEKPTAGKPKTRGGE
ncbi:hypothetical protein ACGFJC_47365 [Nonomuraea fuscirosea]|uniref:hypothetical protein n=1 Tax=Nonomuraea fuscirosea TaxID=1291556 RepID=UPI003712E567